MDTAVIAQLTDMTIASPPNQTPNPIKKVTRSDGGFLLALNENYSDYKATVEFVDGRIYEGPIVKGQLEGDGQMIWSDGKTYEGRFVAGVIDGEGKLTLPSGIRYEGKFHTDHDMTGHGNFIYSDTGDKYDGTIIGGKPDGHGTYTFHSNNT